MKPGNVTWVSRRATWGSVVLDGQTLVVKPEAAQRQLAAEAAGKGDGEVRTSLPPVGGGDDWVTGGGMPHPQKPESVTPVSSKPNASMDRFR